MKQITRLPGNRVPFCAIASMLIVVCQMAGAAGAPAVAAPRVLHFPKDHAVGMLEVRDASLPHEIETFFHWIASDSHWDFLAQAQGDVAVPAGKRVKLTITAAGRRDLSWISVLPPDGIYSLDAADLSDAALARVVQLRGVRDLRLAKGGIEYDRCTVTARGLKALAGLESLEYLVPPYRLTTEGLREIGQLKSLKGLYLESSAVPGDGMGSLAGLPALEELALWGHGIGDAGLARLPALPNLHYLDLGSTNFTDAGMAHLAKQPSLRILAVSHLPLTDAGLNHLAGIPSLERLNLAYTGISNDGLESLKSLPHLAALSLLHTQTDAGGLKVLKEIPTLEDLEVQCNPPRGPRIPDRGIAELAQMKQLKRLYVDVNVSDDGLRLLSSLPRLESLEAFGQEVSNHGLAALGKARHLRKLAVGSGSPSNTELTISGINALAGLGELTSIQIGAFNFIKPGEAPLNISALTNLQELRLPAMRDQDLACLDKLKKLEVLQTGGAGVTDAGLSHLANLESIWWLAIGDQAITDRGVACLDRMHGLKQLNLAGNFTDAGLRSVADHKSLQDLVLSSSSVFAPGSVQRLRESLPNIPPWALIVNPRTLIRGRP